VTVLVSFLAGLLAMTRFSIRARRPGPTAVNVAGAVAAAFTLLVSLPCADPLLSNAATAAIAGTLYALRPGSGDRQASSRPDAI